MGMIRRIRSRRFRFRSRSTSPAAASVAVRISLAAQNAFLPSSVRSPLHNINSEVLTKCPAG